ncbi:MAG: efflux RND transporter permease subunit, partial [Planctomycetes bacterium]|nr:efflux RND transporter permease subunit [Planctomycetota bacterium]
EVPARGEPAPPLPPPPGPDAVPRKPTAITVVTCYEDMPPEQVERLITNRVERWLGQLPGVASCESRSITGVSVVRLALRADTDPALALAGANSLALAALPHLPPGCRPPLAQAVDPAGERVLGLVVVQSATSDEARLADIARNAVRPALGRIPGLMAPVVLGGKERQFGLYLDTQRMQARGLTAGDVARAIERANAAVPPVAGRWGDADLVLGSGTAFRSIEEIGDVPVRTEAGKMVYLRDVAVPKDALVQTSLVRVNGKRAVCLPLFAFGTAPTAGEVQKAVARLGTALAPEAQLTFLAAGGSDDNPAELTAHLWASSGSALDATERRVAAVERFVEGAIPAEEREWIVSEMGLRADPSALYTRHAGPRDATVRVRLSGKRSRTAAEYVQKLRELFAKEKDLADVAARFRAGPVDFAALGNDPADLAVRVRGGTDVWRAEVAARLRRRVGAIDGVAAAQLGQRRDAAHLFVEVDREKAAALGLSAADVSRQVAEAAGRSGPAGLWIEPKTGGSFRVVVRSADAEPTVEHLLNVPLAANGKHVPLSNVARINRETAAVEITRANGVPVLDVWIDLDGKKFEAAAAEVEKVVREEKAPARTSLELLRSAPAPKR